MSPKHLRLIALALVVLLLLWGGSELFSRGSDTVRGSVGLPTLRPAGVDTIALVHGADSIVLARQSATAWTVNGRRAAAGAPAELLQALADTVRPELVAEDSSSFARLGVDSAGAHWLRIRGGGKPLVELLVGASGSDYGSAYLRRPGDRHVYLWRGRLAALVRRPIDDWRDKRIAELATDSVRALAVARGADRYTLRRTGARWTLNGRAADSAAVARYLERLRTIAAAGFATPGEADSTRSLRPVRSLTVQGPHGVLLGLAFDSTPGGFVVRHTAGVGGEGTTVYRMNAWDVDGLTPAGRSLVPAKK